ncbi:TetR/AcrR family transcriptional regulator [Rhizobacter sp. Root1221]|uniref:TetR/AcrR family transcriptional regulator n=1 Tax=Rhizobacter sp. Root1221 TaxID=1736433 RepID=UPI0006FD0B21|nr:TetR/AcrR family transcriptional regulator [Rhizobacter sp. Root1221]KQW01342.1 TetR family transcriptional regulator [Rhizobacter sp. Root1221]
MTDTPSRKEQTHDRIVRTASRAIRRKGYGGIGVADIMKEAGLTHGGFYAHFKSKTDLLAEVADSTGADSLSRLGRIAAAAPDGQSLAAIVDAYLSDRHVEAPETGCPVAALGSELSRQEAPVRRAATRRMKEVIDLIGRQLPGWADGEDRRKALSVYCSLVGALTIARAVDDPALSKAVRDAARMTILDQVT